MIRTLLAGSAAAALLVTAASAGPGTTSDSAWQMAQAQPYQEGQAPAAGEPAAPGAGEPPAAAEQPPAADQPADQSAQEPATTDQPAETAQEPAAPDQPAETAQEPAAPDQPAETAEQPPAGEQPEQAAEAAAEPMDQAVFITDQAATHWLATDYIGQTVYNRQDEAIGGIDDLIVEEDGGLVGFVVGVGGFLGIGKKQVAINLDAVEVQQDEDGRPKLVVAGSKEALLEAPDFVDKETQQAEMERQQREAQQPPAGGAPGAPVGGGPQQ
jgi:hypothetical protein